MVSVFAWLRLWRLPVWAAYAGQAVVAVLVIAMAMRFWQSGDMRLKGALLCIGSLLVTPFALDYDLMLVAPAILLLASYQIGERQIPFGAGLLFLLWFVPFLAQPIATMLALPLASWALLSGFFAIRTYAR